MNCFESSLGPSLDSASKGLSRVLTQAYNQTIQGSVLDPCPCLVCSLDFQLSIILHNSVFRRKQKSFTQQVCNLQQQ